MAGTTDDRWPGALEPISGRPDNEKHSKGLWMKNACKIINFSECPVKIVVITNASYLKCLRTKFVEKGREREVLPFLIPNNDKSDAPYDMSHQYYQEYDLEEYDEDSGDPVSEKIVHLRGHWAVLGIYMDFDFEDRFTLWRLIEAQKGLVINIRDDHIDEAHLADNDEEDEEVENVKMKGFQNIDNIIASIEKKNNGTKLEEIPEIAEKDE